LPVVIGLSVALSLVSVATIVFGGIIIFQKRKMLMKKDGGPRVSTEDNRNRGLAYELSSPSVPGDDGQPTYMNKAFEKEDVTYESLQDQPTTSDHVYTSVEN